MSKARKMVKEFIKFSDLDVCTITLCENCDKDSADMCYDLEFAECDITGEMSMCVNLTVLTNEGQEISLQVTDYLLHYLING